MAKLFRLRSIRSALALSRPAGSIRALGSAYVLTALRAYGSAGGLCARAPLGHLRAYARLLLWHRNAPYRRATAFTISVEISGGDIINPNPHKPIYSPSPFMERGLGGEVSGAIHV